jgi:hypothetical protein
MSPLINITYNDDANVQLFTKELAEKSIAFNWKLKKNYFIFGLRQGIDKAIVFDDKKNMIVGMEAIATKSDMEALNGLMDRIIRKYRIQSYNKTIDSSTGEIKNNEFIAIGLPYEERLSKETKNFLKLVYNLEKGKIKQTTTSHKNLIDDSDKKDKDKGQFFRIINKVEDEIPFDCNSQGMERAQNAKETIIREEQNDERNMNEESENTTSCPNCHSINTLLDSRYNGNSTMRCVDCGYTYTVLSV